MLVRDILKVKGDGIITIGDEALLDDAIALLAEKNIGAVVVTDSAGGLKGILSERDIIRVLQGAPTGFRQTPVTQHMTTSVTTASPDDSLDGILSAMTDGRFRHMPIVQDGQLAGMLSIGDVVKYRIDKAEREAADLKSYITQ